MELLNKNDFFLLEELVKKNFSAKYKDSVIGILWSVLQPLLMMVVLTIIFSTLFHGMIENYPVYLLSGRCIFDFFKGSVNLTMGAIKNNKNILKKTAAPKYIFILGGVISEFINFIITLIILIGVMIVTKSPFYFTTMILSIIPVISLVLTVTGLGLALSIICAHYTDIQHLWSIITMIIMYASAIFYPMNIIPSPYHEYLLLNPLFWIIDQFRSFFIYGTIPDFLNIVNSILISTIILIIGIIIFKKYEKKVMMKI